MNALLRHGDEAVVMAPCYQLFLSRIFPSD
jgi:hypothetical protein